LSPTSNVLQCHPIFVCVARFKALVVAHKKEGLCGQVEYVALTA
jgi:hypothetical protein